MPAAILGFLLLLAGGFVTAGYLYFNERRQTTRKMAEEAVGAVADLNVQRISSWRAERLSDANFIFQNREIAEEVSALGASRDGESGRAASPEWMTSMYANRHYDGIFVLDVHGTVVACVSDAGAAVGNMMDEDILRAWHERRIIFSDIRAEKDSKCHLEIVVPLRSRAAHEGPVIAAIVLRMDAERPLFQILRQIPLVTRTAESILFRVEQDSVVFISPSRHIDVMPTTLHLPANMESLPAAAGARGFEGVMTGRDYRGVPVLAAVRRVPDSPWFLVTKIDADEIFAPIVESAWLIAAVMLLFLVAITLLFLSIVRQRQRKQILLFSQELEERVRRRTEELQAANRDLEAFAYSVSHDLRAPLRAIDGFSLMLEQDYTPVLDGEGRHYLGLVRFNTERMGQLIENLLAFSRVGRQSVHSTTIDMTALAGSVFREIAPPDFASRVVLVINPLPDAQGDPAMIRQVWANLLSNAVKFSSRRDRPKIVIGARVEDGQHVYFVQDNGAGFDMRHADKLFGVFQRMHSTSEFEGTGVGLAIVERIVRKHGGKVWGEGKIDAGASFSFTLPMQGAPEGTD
jgi:signal transduction histidine kinase